MSSGVISENGDRPPTIAEAAPFTLQDSGRAPAGVQLISPFD